MRLFDALLRLFPRDFRDRFGEGMRYTLREELRAARKEGRWAVGVLWVRTSTSLVLHGIAERVVGRDTRGGPRIPARGRGEAMGTMTRELGQAARRLLRRPAFTVTALTTLALGIGGTTAIFSVVEGVILRPLPYPEGDRLVTVGHQSANSRLGIPDAAYLHYADRASTIERIGIWLEISSPIAGLGEPMELNVIRASESLLPTLGIEPMLGRGFVPEDHAPGAPPVVLVSHGFWTRHLGADPEAVGRPLLPGETEIVAGVLPEDFEFLRPEPLIVFGNRFDAPDVFYPLEELQPAQARFGNFIFHAVGRLAPGATVEDARDELGSLMYSATEAYPGGIPPERLTNERFRPVVASLKDALVGDVADVLWILLAAVGFVLVIALANVANLFLVRAEARTSEIALRRALGASRGSIGLAFASESALLCLLGGALGVALARLATEPLLALVPGDIARLDLVGLNGTVVLFSVGLAALAAVVLGLVPTLRGDDPRLHARLGVGSRGDATSPRRLRARRVLLVSQIALSLVLLVGSTLLFTSLGNLRDVDPGFDPSGTLTLRLPLSPSILRAADFAEGPVDARRSAFMLELVDRLDALPGVRQAAFSADLPLDGDEWNDGIATEDDWPSGEPGSLSTQRVFIGPGYLSTIGATMARGRELERRDFAGQPRVAVVNESFARARWPGQDPIGRRIAQYTAAVNPEDDVFYTVVGVVEDIREASLMTPPEPTVYLPTVFLPEGHFGMWVSNLVAVVRTEGDPMALLPRVREEVLAHRPDVPIKDVATLEQVTEASFGQVRFAVTLIGVAAVVSLLLGIVGIYGTVAYVVAQRTREFGVRIALGASGGDVSRGVLRGAVVVGAQGLAVGFVAALAGARILESLLFGVSANEPAVYVAVSAALLAVVFVASLVPARRAARVDPMVAMRAE